MAPSDFAQGCPYIAAEDAAAAATTAFAAHGAAGAYLEQTYAASYARCRSAAYLPHAFACCWIYMGLNNAEWPA